MLLQTHPRIWVHRHSMPDIICVWIEYKEGIKFLIVKIHIVNMSWEREMTGALGYGWTLILRYLIPDDWEYHCGLLIRMRNCTSGYKLSFDLSLSLGSPVPWLFFWVYKWNKSHKQLVPSPTISLYHKQGYWDWNCQSSGVDLTF